MPLNTSDMTSTLTIRCRVEGEMARERIHQPPSYAEAKKIRSPTLSNQWCLSGHLKKPVVFYQARVALHTRVCTPYETEFVDHPCVFSSPVVTRELLTEGLCFGHWLG